MMERLGCRRRGLLDSEESIHEAERKAVRFDEFGDRSYVAGLRVLLEGYDREARLTPSGRTMVDRQRFWHPQDLSRGAEAVY